MATINPATDNNTILQNYLNQQADTIAKSKAANTNTSGSGSTIGGLAANFDTFLKILTTQLKYQDPTNATDTNQFTQELVQFAGVEQQLNTNSNLQTLINLQKSGGGLAMTIGYIGKYVEVPSVNTLTLQNGKSEIAYGLPAGIKDVSINVVDSSGKIVTTLKGAKASGLNYLSWDGKDANGNQMPDGVYGFKLNATLPDGSAANIKDIRALGMVTSIQSNSDGTISLMLGNGLKVGSSNVSAVYDAANLPPSTPTS